MSYIISKEKLLKILKKIELNQNKFRDPCLQELGANEIKFNTMPIALIHTNTLKYSLATSIFKNPNTNSYQCFKTPFFRITKVNFKKETILLELLQPQSSTGEIGDFSIGGEICNLFSSVSITKFIRTGIYITLNIEPFNGIKCLGKVNAKLEIPKGITDNDNGNNALKIKTSEYIAIAIKNKKKYYNNDGLENFNKIRDPSSVSYYNLFINAMLQPPEFYEVLKGELILKTQDLPLKGSYIILQSITVNK